jgi:hypothetical protein
MFFKKKKQQGGAYFSFVNRSSIFLEPTDAYLDWAKHSPDESDDVVVSVLRDEVSAYLIPEMDADPDEWLKLHYTDIFEHELYAWVKDEKFWPEDRSYEAFRRYFKVYFSSSVIDASDDPLENSYYE